MLAWRLRHRVSIEEPVEVQDQETGAITHTWRTLVVGGVHMGSVPAEALTGPGREMHAASAKQAESDARINLRWFPGLDETMRILWDGKVYGITSIETDATARREYRLRVKAGLTDGN